MKGFERKNQLFSLCGLNCRLCPMLLGNYCGGCGNGNQSCRIAKCSLEHGQIEYCYECRQYPCEKYQHTLICIHKSDKGDNLDRYSNLAFVEIPIAKAILTESADEAKSLLKGYVLNSQQKKKLNRIRTNYGYQTITGK